MDEDKKEALVAFFQVFLAWYLFLAIMLIIYSLKNQDFVWGRFIIIGIVAFFITLLRLIIGLLKLKKY